MGAKAEGKDRGNKQGTGTKTNKNHPIHRRGSKPGANTEKEKKNLRTCGVTTKHLISFSSKPWRERERGKEGGLKTTQSNYGCRLPNRGKTSEQEAAGVRNPKRVNNTHHSQTSED